MNCNEALTILLKPDHGKRQIALAYVRNHPECLTRVDQLARTILTSADDELPCVEAQAQLADYYYVAQQAQEDVAQRFPLLHLHLDRCPYCQAEYAALTAAMALYAEDALPAVTAPNPWNLDFLPGPPPIWAVEELRRKLTQPLSFIMTKTQALLETSSLQLAVDVHATAMRGDDDIRYTVLSIPDETAAIRFDFTVKPTPNGMANVTIHVTQTATEQPLPDIRIALHRADGTLVTRSFTDSAGQLELPQMNADEYIIQAKNDDDLWEIPMTILSDDPV
ncbi:MAG: hypothetical protein KDE19_05290 [Caldilineaceae bacterium]|nr:hypothetical protein [Caldilineaceae bacterium]